MKISVLQPKIVRGNIEYNVKAVNRLLNDCEGNLAILAEYALTGSLVLDKNADPRVWADKSASALKKIDIPAGKSLLLNHLVSENGKLYNESTLLPAGPAQRKCFPDSTEIDAGIHAGKDFPLFSFGDKSFKIIICSDLRKIDNLPTDGADFLFFIFHFTQSNHDNVMDILRDLSCTRKLPIIAASLCSDKNCGHSAYVNGNTVVSLGNSEGILEISL